MDGQERGGSVVRGDDDNRIGVAWRSSTVRRLPKVMGQDPSVVVGGQDSTDDCLTPTGSVNGGRRVRDKENLFRAARRKKEEERTKNRTDLNRIGFVQGEIRFSLDLHPNGSVRFSFQKTEPNRTIEYDPNRNVKKSICMSILWDMVMYSAGIEFT